jgi:hypothetical protein
LAKKPNADASHVISQKGERIEIPRSLAAYYERIGAEVLNFRRAMIKHYRGRYYVERCLIKVAVDGEVSCTNKEYEPTKEEQQAIKTAIGEFDFPHSILGTERSAWDHVDRLTKEDPEGSCFLFYASAEGEALESTSVRMIQQRVIGPKGDRLFVPWSFFSDGQWRNMEPDGALPFWKPKRIRSNRIMVHEGAKAAAAAEALASSADGETYHPWAKELRQYEHWGMIGGALAPHRTDYDELHKRKPEEVIYVADNDHPGKEALQRVSRHYGRRMCGVMFDGRWKEGWDMADPMPEEMFEDGRFTGPPLRDLIEPATWATDLLKGEKGRPSAVIRRDFAEEWFHCVQPEVFVHRERPNVLLGTNEFNNVIRPHSDVDDTARLLKAHKAGKGVNLRYSPSSPSGVYTDDRGLRCLNTYVAPKLEEEKGDPTPFLDFLTHLIPVDEDRREMARWLATLIAKPQVKMMYGVLLVSETQGVGKSTLGDRVLAPLVGEHNVSRPAENTIVDSDFNYWAAHKRLAVVHEIYAGHSAKAYNKLKGLVTDDHITVNKKYMAEYEIENWLHVFACSNSMNALRLDINDRRWFLPTVSERVRPQGYWGDFNRWLTRRGGLGIIKRWARELIEADAEMMVKPGETAPFSDAKRESIEEGMSEGMRLVARTLSKIKEETLGAEGPPPIILDRELIRGIVEVVHQGRSPDKFLERPLTIRKVAKSIGWYVGQDRVEVNNWGGQDSWKSRFMTLDKTLSMARPINIRNAGINPIDVVSIMKKEAVI